MEETTMVKEIMKAFSLEDVTVTDSYWKNALEKELAYLLSLEPDKLVAGFYEMSGKPGKAKKYLGWEDTEIKGHTLGHYMTAMAQGYLSTKSKVLLERLSYTISELKKCQLSNGYLFASEEEIFDRVENRKPAWVPWYTMDKILVGIISVYHATNNKEAYDLADKLGDWVYNRIKGWSKELQELVLVVEYGGMNDALYELYKMTAKEEHLYAAHMFDELSLFTPIKNKQDILDGKHANTTIPKILGALNRYIALGEEERFYLEVAENFWEIVVNHHTYVTGGNSEWEHFGTPDVLDKERTNCNCETCNTHNMLKLSMMLFQVTGEKKYADYYERTKINAILSSQNPETGMSTYFQPMETGFFKVFGTPFDKFWCCTGTGMENFTKLSEGIYFWKKNSLYVNDYVSSSVVWKEKNVKLIQDTKFPESEKISFEIETFGQKNLEFSLFLRIPDWLASIYHITLNGKHILPAIENGYVLINRNWENGDVLEMTLPMEVNVSSLADNPNAVAFTYGPLVLSAALGTEEMRITQTGVAVDIPIKNMDIKDYILVENMGVKEWLEDIKVHLIKKEGKLQFSLKETDEDERLVFTPHYRQYKELYGIYWEILESDSNALKIRILEEEKRKRFEGSIIDKIPLGNDQYELKSNVKGENTHAGGIEGHRGRVMRENGWVSYDMKVDSNEELYLGTTYFKNDIGKAFKIFLDDQLMTIYTLDDNSEKQFFNKEHKIPKELVSGKKSVKVRFEHGNPFTVNSIWDLLYIRRGGSFYEKK
ncbi:MAG: hypothetical protein GX913_06495 [Clostridiales bacterium]|nr:hypothetical protein [Clostridiales bacterium]